jgi:hypothetical protein
MTSTKTQLKIKTAFFRQSASFSKVSHIYKKTTDITQEISNLS